MNDTATTEISTLSLRDALPIGLGAVMAYGPTLLALRVVVFGTVLLGIAVTDLQHYLIPDGFTVFGLIWLLAAALADRKSTRLNSSHANISYAVFSLKKKKKIYP